MAVELDAGAFKALSSPTRISLLKKLYVKPRSLSSLAEESGLSVQATDEHMHKLVQAGLVEKDKRNKWAYYRLTASGRSLVQPDRQPVYLMLAASFMLIMAAAITWTQADAVPAFGAGGAAETRAADYPADAQAAKAMIAADANASGQSALTVPAQLPAESAPSMAQAVPAPESADAANVSPAAMPWVYLFLAGGALSLAIAIHWWRRQGI